MIYPYYPVYTPQQNTQAAPQIQNNGLVIVKSVEEAMSYPVAPGNSVTFKDENKPYIYTKTLGFSQLDQPLFEVFRLEKETSTQSAEIAPRVDYFPLSDGERLKSEIEALKGEIEFLKEYIEEDKKDA